MVSEGDSILKELEVLEVLEVLFIIFLVVGSLFEVGIIVFAYVNADEVECNWLWCTFISGDTIERHDSFTNITKTITSTSECYVNGNKVNCSEVKDYSNFALEWN